MTNQEATVEQAAIELVSSAPTAIVNLHDCQRGVNWLRAKRDWDKAVDEAHAESIKAANAAHKAALKVVKTLKEPSDKVASDVRTRIEAYAENKQSDLPDGVFRRKVYRVTVTNAEEVPIQFRTPDEKLIAEYVKRTDNTIRIPGVEVVEETAVTIRQGE